MLIQWRDEPAVDRSFRLQVPTVGMRAVSMPEDRRIVTRSLEQVHAGQLAHQLFARISDGQRQRVLLARAICHELDHLDGILYTDRAESVERSDD